MSAHDRGDFISSPALGTAGPDSNAQLAGRLLPADWRRAIEGAVGHIGASTIAGLAVPVHFVRVLFEYLIGLLASVFVRTNMTFPLLFAIGVALTQRSKPSPRRSDRDFSRTSLRRCNEFRAVHH
jgi:hypothetical protein